MTPEMLSMLIASFGGGATVVGLVKLFKELYARWRDSQDKQFESSVTRTERIETGTHQDLREIIKSQDARIDKLEIVNEEYQRRMEARVEEEGKLRATVAAQTVQIEALQADVARLENELLASREAMEDQRQEKHRLKNELHKARLEAEKLRRQAGKAVANLDDGMLGKEGN